LHGAGPVGIVPRAYDIFSAYEGIKGRTINIKMKKNGKI
jgi:hypothetical protein